MSVTDEDVLTVLFSSFPSCDTRTVHIHQKWKNFSQTNVVERINAQTQTWRMQRAFMTTIFEHLSGALNDTMVNKGDYSQFDFLVMKYQVYLFKPVPLTGCTENLLFMVQQRDRRHDILQQELNLLRAWHMDRLLDVNGKEYETQMARLIL